MYDPVASYEKTVKPSELYKIADHFGVNRLRTFASTEMHANMCEETVIETMKLAHVYSLTDLRTAAFDWFADSTSAVDDMLRFDANDALGLEVCNELIPYLLARVRKYATAEKRAAMSTSWPVQVQYYGN
eukprot:gene33591-41450_t